MSAKSKPLYTLKHFARVVANLIPGEGAEGGSHFGLRRLKDS
jgi:hypothetical protein